MFYYKQGLTRRVRLHPEYIGHKTDLQTIIKKMAMQDVKGQFSLEHGYYVLPICVTEVGDGHCLPLVGFVEYAITFEAVCLYPVVGEVIFAEVICVTDTCIIFRYACMYGVIRSFSLNENDYFKYEEKSIPCGINPTEEGLKVKVGLFRSEINEEKVIEAGTVVRLRITRRTLGGNGFVRTEQELLLSFLVGSMCCDFLGPVANSPSPLLALKPKIEQLDPALKNLKVEEGIIPHEELQKVWKIEPYCKTEPLSPPVSP